MPPLTDPAGPVDGLIVEQHDSITVITFNRPNKRNALTRNIVRSLPQLLATAAQTSTAVVISGGSSYFSAGMDLSELGNGANDAQVDDELAALSQAISNLSVPVIAAIEGACVGGAVEIALSCSVRVISSDAFFAVPAVRLGVLYRPDGIAAITQLVGRQTAMRLLVIGETIRGVDALTAGLAATVTEPGSVLAEALRMAELTKTSVPSAAAATKAVIIAASSDSTDLSQFEAERARLLTSPERQQALVQAQSQRPSETPKP